MAKTLGQIIDDAVNYILGILPTLSVLEGTVARDIIIESPAREFERVYNELDRIATRETLEDSTVFTNDELDDLASNIGLVRSPGVQATGVAVFRVANFTSSMQDIYIPAGTEISTSPTTLSPNRTSFVTTSSRTFLSSNAATYFNVATGYYEITCSIQASIVGATGNVSSGSINTVVSSLAGGVTVINELPTSGGADEETNEQLLERIRIKLTGNNIGTPNGILSIVNANPIVYDSLLIRPGDEELVRNQLGNSADVVIIGTLLEETTESRTYTGGQVNYVLSRQPVVSVGDTIEGTSADTSLAFTFIKDTHYTVEHDYTSLTGGTSGALTKVVFLGNPFPLATSTFETTYSHNSLVNELQSTLDSDDNKIIGTDIWVREATEVLCRVGATIKIFPGYVKSDVAANAVNNVASLLNGTTLGQDIDRSDIITTIQNTDGVDSVDTTTLSLQIKKPVDPGFTTVTDIIIARAEYARPDTSPGAITIT